MDENKRERIVNLVVYQGNKFIKELLREIKLPIGSTEKEFRINIQKSLDAGKLTERDIEEWLDRVEGWGDQHVYVYRVQVRKNMISKYRDASQFARLMKAASKDKLINRSHVNLMPEKRILTLIQHSGQRIRFVWHESLAWKKRREEKDFDKYDKELGSRIYYQAYLEQWGRGVASFEWRFDLSLMAVFIPRRISEDYEFHRDQIVNTVKGVLKALSDWAPLFIAKAIFALDDKANAEHPIDPTQRILRSTKTNFETPGGVVVIESTRSLSE